MRSRFDDSAFRHHMNLFPKRAVAKGRDDRVLETSRPKIEVVLDLVTLTSTIHDPRRMATAAWSRSGALSISGHSRIWRLALSS
jgi:hypothetical protein